MSKWSSVRFSVVCLALALLVACGQQGRRDDDAGGPHGGSTGPITHADTSVDDVASAEPGKDRHQWAASDASTRAITGNLTASVEGRGGPLMLAFATGITEQGERDIRMNAADPMGTGPRSFASVLKANPDASVFLYRVTNEDIAPVAKNGGLCGADRTSYLVVTEYVSSKGDWVFRVAAFKGPTAPGPGADAEPALCGAYFYVSP